MLQAISPSVYVVLLVLKKIFAPNYNCTYWAKVQKDQYLLILSKYNFDYLIYILCKLLLKLFIKNFISVVCIYVYSVYIHDEYMHCSLA